MQNGAAIIDQLYSYVQFVRRLRGLRGQVWFSLVGTGKWSIHDIVAHIMMWDKNLLETRIRKINRGQETDLQEDADVQGFNDRAVAYGKSLSQDKLIDDAIRYRSELVSELKKLPSAAFDMKTKSKTAMSLSLFLEQMFVFHDQHHTKQIEDHLSRLEEVSSQEAKLHKE